MVTRFFNSTAYPTPLRVRVSLSISFIRSAHPISYASLPSVASYDIHSLVRALLANRTTDTLVAQPRRNALVVEAMVARKNGNTVVLFELF